MTQIADTNPARPDADEVRQQLAGKHVCPFCGVIRGEANQPCPRCTMEDNSGTRTATRQRIGPWFVLQARNPSAPGMKFATLLSLVRKSHVTPRSIVRGPTTHQLWTFASKVRGLSREFGICYHCGNTIDFAANSCTHCDRPQEAAADPDTLLEAGASTAPEMTITASTATPETGMDGGGASLDLQLDDPSFRPSPPRTPRPSKPVVGSQVSKPTSTPMVMKSVAAPGTKSQEEAILSARELAAAFQLDFKPAPDARGPVIEHKAHAKSPKSQDKAFASSKPVKKVGLFKTAVVLLTIALIAATIVLGLREDWRERAVAWAGDTWTHIKSSLEAPAVTPKPKPANKDQIIPAVVDITPPAVVVPKPHVEIVTPVIPATPKVDAPVVTPPVAVVPIEPKVETPKPVEPKIEPKPDPKPAAVTPPVALPPINANMDIDEATALARQLRSRAIDAEGQDWPQAVRLYEQIQKLPQEAWPGDLQIRLDNARKNLK